MPWLSLRLLIMVLPAMFFLKECQIEPEGDETIIIPRSDHG